MKTTFLVLSFLFISALSSAQYTVYLVNQTNCTMVFNLDEPGLPLYAVQPQTRLVLNLPAGTCIPGATIQELSFGPANCFSDVVELGNEPLGTNVNQWQLGICSNPNPWKVETTTYLGMHRGTPYADHFIISTY